MALESSYDAVAQEISPVPEDRRSSKSRAHETRHEMMGRQNGDVPQNGKLPEAIRERLVNAILEIVRVSGWDLCDERDREYFIQRGAAWVSDLRCMEMLSFSDEVLLPVSQSLLHQELREIFHELTGLEQPSDMLRREVVQMANQMLRAMQAANMTNLAGHKWPGDKKPLRAQVQEFYDRVKCLGHIDFSRVEDVNTLELPDMTHSDRLRVVGEVSEMIMIPAERYGVDSFDLGKKAAIVETSKPYTPEGTKPIWAFCEAINALHFDGADGRLVSEEDAWAVAYRDATAAQAFERFLAENVDLVGPTNPPGSEGSNVGKGCDAI